MDSATERLTGLELTKRAYALVWRHRIPLASLTWPLSICFAIVDAVEPAQRTMPIGPEKALLGLIVLVTLIVVAIFYIPAATSAYRLFVKGPGQRFGLTFRTEEKIYFGASLRLFLRVLLISLPMIVVTIAAAAAIGAGMGAVSAMLDLPRWPLMVVGFTVMFAGWLIVSYVSVRYMLVLPAAALGLRAALADSARAMDGNMARLWFSYLATLAPILLLRLVARILISKVLGVIGVTAAVSSVAAAIATVPLQIASTLLPLAALSLLYAELSTLGRKPESGPTQGA